MYWHKKEQQNGGRCVPRSVSESVYGRLPSLSLVAATRTCERDGNGYPVGAPRIKVTYPRVGSSSRELAPAQRIDFVICQYFLFIYVLPRWSLSWSFYWNICTCYRRFCHIIQHRILMICYNNYLFKYFFTMLAFIIKLMLWYLLYQVIAIKLIFL